jgi:hypothetical protein
MNATVNELVSASAFGAYEAIRREADSKSKSARKSASKKAAK